MIKFDTAVSFINNHLNPSGYSAGQIISFEGYTTTGDKGAARWRSLGTIGAVSIDPLTNNSPNLSDASGNEFVLVGEGVIDLNVLGGTGVSYQNIADAAGLVYSQGLTSNPNVSDRYIIADEAGMVARANPQVGEAYIVSDRADGIFDTVTVGTTAGVDLPNAYNIIVSTVDATKCFVLRNDGTASAKQYGLTLDGVVDDTAGFVLWANATTNPKPDAGTARITGEVLITSPWVYKPGNEFIVFPDFDTAQYRAIAFETDDIDVEFKLDGDGGTFGSSVGNKYGVYSGKLSGATKYKNHKINVYYDNWLYSDGNTGATNLIVSHAYYANNVDNINIEGSEMHKTSGAAYFIRDCTAFNGHRVKCSENAWYPFNLESGVDGFLISLCEIDQTANTNGVYWGGGINIQSQQADSGERNKNGLVMKNVIKGKFSYGSVIRANSCENVVLQENNLDGVEVGAVASAADLTAIRVDTRGISTAAQNGPCEQVTIRGNRIKAGLSGANTMQAIYASNQWQTARDALDGLFIYDNEIISPDTSNYWWNAIILHGFEGGIQNATIKGNFGTTYMQSGPIVDGAIGLVANNAAGTVRDVHLGRNAFTDLGTPASSYQLGLGVGGYVDEVYNDSRNTFDNYFYGVRTFTNSGPTLDLIDDNTYKNIGGANELFGVVLSRYGLQLTGSATYDPPNLAAGATTFTDIAITGAALGDIVDAAFSLDNAGVIFTGYVRVANSVRVYLENKTGGAVDLGSGTLEVRVTR